MAVTITGVQGALTPAPSKATLSSNYLGSSVEFTSQYLPDVYEKEVERYLPYLKKHIEIIKPKIILLLGSTAMNAILKNTDVISKMRGKWYEIEISNLKIFSIVSFHPAYLLRQPDQKKFSWIDLKMIREKLKKF